MHGRRFSFNVESINYCGLGAALMFAGHLHLKSVPCAEPKSTLGLFKG
jgi:hypothetical protein